MMILGFFESLLFILGILIFIFPYFYIYAKAVDQASMVKKVNTSKLTEGDWLYEDVKVEGKLIRANWAGLSKEDIRLIKKKYKNKRILIRQGIPFIPVFLIAFIVLILVYLFEWGLWNSFW